MDKTRMHASAVAVLGYGCRFPGGVVDGESFWRLLAEGRDAVTEVPPDRWNVNAFATSRLAVAGKSVAKWGGFLDHVDLFEPSCFGISPREAAFVDPQQRLLLETAWEALEMAGLPLEGLAGSRTGVFVGISTGDYLQLQTRTGSLRGLSAFTSQGCALSIAANRLSYCLDLRGPSFIIDTACSSSAVALDRAVKSLESGESDLALVGGVNVLLTPEMFVCFSAGSFLSPEGRCKAFDASANGFVRAEGGGIVVLKRLHEAERDGDPIQAVIVASGSNQDGRTGGLSMPNGDAQAALLSDVYAEAGIALDEIAYVEAHGTGTAIGDPTEAHALGRVFARGRRGMSPLLIGSVKSNIGHVEAGSGMASLIKVILMLQKRSIPPSLHFHVPNPRIAFDELGLRIPVALEPWPNERRAAAGINSFGFGGANAHVVVQEHVPRARGAFPAPTGVEERGGHAADRVVPLVLTARSREALADLAGSWIEFLDDAERSGTTLSDIAFTAALRRSHAAWRVGIAAADYQSVRENLSAFRAGEARAEVHVAQRMQKPPRVAFAFCGQGAQWLGMGRGLMGEPVFRAAMEQCDRLLRREVGWSLLAELDADEKTSRLEQTSFAQPALFALQVSVARLWESWGIRPQWVVGHSVGEIAAAHVAGILTLESAVRIIAHRGRCIEEYAIAGRMVAAALCEADARRFLSDGLCIAAVNAPQMVTLAGEREAVEHLGARLTEANVWWKALRVNHAFHSGLVDGARQPFRDAIGTIEHAAARCEMISTVTGTSLNGEMAPADYWWENVRRPVRFRDAVEQLARGGAAAVVEIGPHPVLAAPIRQCLAASSPASFVLPFLLHDQPEPQVMASSLAGLFTRGVAVDWQTIWPQGGRCVELPRHPWRRERFWQETPESRRARLREEHHPLLGHDHQGGHRVWQTAIDPQDLTWLADHRVAGEVIFPAAGLVEMLAAAARRMLKADRCILDDVDIQRALFVASEAIPEVQVVADPACAGLSVFSRMAGKIEDWTKHCQAGFRPLAGGAEPVPLVLADWPVTPPEDGTCGSEVEWASDEFYETFRRMGLHYGPAFRGVREVRFGREAVLGRVEVPEAVCDRDPAYDMHPTLLDGCFQVLLSAVLIAGGSTEHVFLPERIRQVRFFRPAGLRAWSEVRLRSASQVQVTADIRIYTDAGEPAMEVLGFCCRAVRSGRGRKSLDACFYEVQWQHRPLPEKAIVCQSLEIGVPLDVLVRRADAEARGVWHDRDIRGVEDLQSPLDNVARTHVAAALRQLGFKLIPDEEITLESLIDSGQLLERYQPLAERCIQDLVDSGHARRTGERSWIVTSAVTRVEMGDLWRTVLAKEPESYAHLRLIEVCGTRLADVWAGRVDPLEILFSDEGVGLLEHLYRDVPWFRYANTFHQGLIAGVVQRLAADRPLRVLEVGAGTGGTTDSLLPVLPGHRTEYWFTDVSPFFLARAKRKFRACEFLRFERLDIEQDLSAQGIPAGAFDVVLAADVLHGAADIRAAVRRCAEALAPGGLLLLRELCEVRLWYDIIFGLTDGWWKYRDDPLRRGSRGPLAPASQWKSWLAAEGLEVAATPPTCDNVGFAALLAARKPLGQTVPASPLQQESASPEPHWLIFADQAGGGARLVETLRRHGRRCVALYAGESFRRIEPDCFSIDPESPADLQRLREACGDLANSPLAAVHLWSLDFAGGSEALLNMEKAADAICHSVMHALQAFADRSSLPLRRLFLVTRGAHVLAGEHDVSRFVQGALIGLGRVAGTEFPGVEIRLVDLDPAVAGIEALWAELTTADSQEETAWRGTHRFVPRLVPFERAHPESEVGGVRPPFEIVVGRPGDPGSLEPREISPAPPGPGEVQVDVHFAALNFRDVLKVLGTFPADDPRQLLLGDELSGIVTAVGPGVSTLRPGERVVACGLGCFRSVVNLPAMQVVRAPDRLSLSAAVSMPIAFLTADLSLRRVARLAVGEVVLIHSAAGGVGMAAMQIARLAGARIFATAKSPAKRDLLAKLGAERLMDSRTLAFADELLEATGGRGADVILNSLAGQAMVRSLACLAPCGRFLELGKRDFYENTAVGLWPLRRNVSYHGIDLSSTFVDQPQQIGNQLVELFEHAAAGRLTPLPVRVFPAHRATDAVRLMLESGHIGKIVLDMTQCAEAVRPAAQRIPIRPDGAYLVCGAFGGVGRALTRWLVERGARHLVLLGRGGPHTDEAKALEQELAAAGVSVLCRACDAADEERLADVIEEARQTMPPLAGVFHLAMVLDDATLLNLNRERFQRVLRPKMHGAWNLHCQTIDQPLDLFVMFGSATAAVGNHGQANYAAGNAALEALASHRQAAGLPATTIAWGVLGNVGYVAQRPELLDSLAKLGMAPLDPGEVWQALDAVVCSGRDVGVVIRADWPRLTSKLRATQRCEGLLARLTTAAQGAKTAESSDSLREALAEADPDARVELVRGFVQARVAGVLGTTASAVEIDRPLSEMGLDSLMGIELVLRIEADIGVSVPKTALARDMTVERLCAALLPALAGARPDESRCAAAGPPHPGVHERRGPRIVHLGGDPATPAVFCIHPADGELGVYRSLAETLAESCSVYGVESRLLADEGAASSKPDREAAVDTIEELAEAYATAIVAHRARDEAFRLFGFSLGGLIALRTARVLEDRGHSVAFVGLAECDPTWGGIESQRVPKIAVLLADMVDHLQTEFGALKDGAVDRVRQDAPDLARRLVDAAGLTPESGDAGTGGPSSHNRFANGGDLLVEWIAQRGDLRDETLRPLMARYASRVITHIRILARGPHPSPRRAAIHVWNAAEGLAGDGVNWGVAELDPAEVHVLPGSHFQILAPPSSRTIAHRMRELAANPARGAERG